MYHFSGFQNKIDETLQWLSGELAKVRTGRANPALLDSVKVDAYGSKVPLKQVGNIGSEDARTLRIEPYDSSQIQAIESAVAKADLGVTTSSDSQSVRVHFPELTEETRTKMLKAAKAKLEEARVTVRNEREDVWNEIKRKEKAGEMSEDEKYRAKEKMQEMVDEANEALEELYEKKVQQLSG